MFAEYIMVYLNEQEDDLEQKHEKRGFINTGEEKKGKSWGEGWLQALQSNSSHIYQKFSFWLNRIRLLQNIAYLFLMFSRL